MKQEKKLFHTGMNDNSTEEYERRVAAFNEEIEEQEAQKLKQVENVRKTEKDRLKKEN